MYSCQNINKGDELTWFYEKHYNRKKIRYSENNIIVSQHYEPGYDCNHEIYTKNISSYKKDFL